MVIFTCEHFCGGPFLRCILLVTASIKAVRNCAKNVLKYFTILSLCTFAKALKSNRGFGDTYHTYTIFVEQILIFILTSFISAYQYLVNCIVQHCKKSTALKIFGYRVTKLFLQKVGYNY